MTQPPPETYLEMAEEAVRSALSAGASHAEAVAGRARDIAVNVENTSIKGAEADYGESITVRAFVEGAMASLTAEGLEGTAPGELGAECARLAAAATPDPDFRDLPHPEPAEEVPGLYDPALEEFAVAEAVRIALQNIDQARAVCERVILQGEVVLGLDVGALANSNGVRITRQTTSIHLLFFAVVREGEKVGSYYDFDVGRNLEDVELTGLGRRVAEEAKRFLGARKVSTGRRDLVLGPLATYAFVQSVLGAANAESVQRGRSYLVGCEGRRIASPLITVVDDPLVPRGVRSGAHDGEGTRRQKLTIIDRGVLTTYLHNSYTAGKAGKRSTGHGTTGGGISPTNIQILPGDTAAADIIAGVEDGIYINPGSISPDITSGEISSPIDFGFRIEKGQLTYPVVNSVVGGTVWELLERIDAVSSDYRSEPGSIMPTIRIRDVLIAGGESEGA